MRRSSRSCGVIRALCCLLEQVGLHLHREDTLHAMQEHVKESLELQRRASGVSRRGTAGSGLLPPYCFSSTRYQDAPQAGCG